MLIPHVFNQQMFQLVNIPDIIISMVLFQVKVENSDLQIHDRQTVLLAIRTENNGLVETQVYKEARMEDMVTPLAAQLYDLPLDYDNLEELNEKLHSNQLGDSAKKLHDDEINFSNNTRGITGAVQGTVCENYNWWIQTDVRTNCNNEPEDDACIRKRTGTKNVMEFRNMALEDSVHYFICVHGYGGSCVSMKVCSNGFIIDTRPPLPGVVIVPATLSDSTSFLLQWEGFQDIEAELELPYASGIKEYFYGIGTISLSHIQ